MVLSLVYGFWIFVTCHENTSSCSFVQTMWAGGLYLVLCWSICLLSASSPTNSSNSQIEASSNGLTRRMHPTDDCTYFEQLSLNNTLRDTILPIILRAITATSPLRVGTRTLYERQKITEYWGRHDFITMSAVWDGFRRARNEVAAAQGRFRIFCHAENNWEGRDPPMCAEFERDGLSAYPRVEGNAIHLVRLLLASISHMTRRIAKVPIA